MFNARTRSRTVKFVILLTAATVVAVLTFFYLQHLQQQKTVITTDVITSAAGKIIAGKNDAESENRLQTKSKLTFESEEFAVENTDSTAAILKWQKEGEGDGFGVEMRTNNGDGWSSWVETSVEEDRKDGTEPHQSTVLISSNIHQVQYRFRLSGSEQQPSPVLQLDKTTIETIDTTKGPSLDKKTPWEKLTSVLKPLSNTAHAARENGPRVHSRLAWGSPEPYDSPRWEPEYRSLNRTIVHHTATAGVTDSAASLRAIWHYHANSLGWGDIGYNYIVDQAGNVFQGRFFDQPYATANNVDVVAGHAYGNNYGTSGISALGDFTNTSPTTSLVHSIGEMAAYKLGPYNLNPAGGETYGGNLLGHRDVGQTACPGQKLYAQFPTIRSVASAIFPRYQVKPFVWQYVGQGAYTDASRLNPIDLYNVAAVPGRRYYMTVKAKNVGSRTWYKDEQNPIRLGTSNPQDRSSAFYDATSWFSSGRAALLEETSVAPNQEGTFNFSIVAPQNNNVATDLVTKEYFNLLAEGATWMNDPGLFWRVTILKPYAWEYVNQYSYSDPARQNPIDLYTTPVEPGQRIYLTVEARNTGSKTWLPTGQNPVRLGTSNPLDRTSQLCDSSAWVSCSRAVNVTQSTEPGQVGKFEFSVLAPQNNSGTEKTYREYFNPLAEGVVWFNNPGLQWYFRVSSN